MPGRPAFRARRLVAAGGIGPGKTEPHGNDGDLPLVIKPIAIDLEPSPQAIARAIVPGNARLMDDAARRLTDNQEPGTRRSAQDRPAAKGQLGSADPAS